jgi:large subunit ribosomal protein L25
MRQEGFVPCVLYGFDVDPVHFKVKETDLHPLIYTKQVYQVDVSMNGQSWECLLKDVDYHPVTDHPIHADFQVLHPDRPIKVSVPIRFHGVSVGQERGGELVQVFNEVTLKSLPKNIPSSIDVDIGELDIGDAIHIDDLSVPGVEFLLDPQQTVCSVVGGRLEIVGAEPAPAEPEAGVEEEEVALEEGEEPLEEAPEGEAEEGVPEEEA